MKTAHLHQYHFSFFEFIARAMHRQDRVRVISSNRVDIQANLQKSISLAQQKVPSANINSSDFIASIVHELKTPLSAIISFSEFLKDDLKNSKSLEECINYANEINAVATEMNELIHDILDVEAATLSGNFSVDLSKDLDLKDAIKRSVRINYDYSLKRNVTLQSEIADGIKTIKLDAKRMKQVLTNLISNAVKYSPNQGIVKITARKVIENNQDFLEICVADQGFGMSDSQIEIAFKKYQTIPNPNSGSVDSFGLGLPIAKQLVELQNGKLEVKSRVGQGTEIKLKFPYSM